METVYFTFYEVIPGTADFDDYLEARYLVFCEELGRVDAPGMFSSRGHPIETDPYDVCSRHFIARHKASGVVAGFMRIIMPNEHGLNVEQRYVIDHPLPYTSATADKIGEISRLAVTPHFRRRHSDQGKPIQGDPESEMTLKTEGVRHHQPELVLGMYREVYQLCRQTGLDYCMAAMDNLFSRLLTRLGFPFVAVGPMNPNVQPARRVYIISATEMERMLGAREATILQFMQTQLNTSEEPASQA
ncbi:PEP-CTERM/exosortase system-associated acyltransferase [Hydrogenophaga sp.]|uniref:PEP-CTERM/exosortase system-associated acyltransferase n=1 Tax=Hydrogenophaga sp. TaxID=1904254 RepID=UPI003AF478C7